MRIRWLMVRLHINVMRRFLFHFLVFVLLLGVCSCAAPRQMRFVERCSFPESVMDSVLLANDLPLDLGLWRSSSFVTSDRNLYQQWVYVKQVYSKDTDEAIYTIEGRDSVFLFVHRRVSKVKED